MPKVIPAPRKSELPGIQVKVAHGVSTMSWNSLVFLTWHLLELGQPSSLRAPLTSPLPCRLAIMSAASSQDVISAAVAAVGVMTMSS